MNTTNPAASLTDHIGARVMSVHRVLFEGEGEDGEVQIHFENGVARFRCAANGEQIEVSAEEWKDPFGQVLSPENAEFAKTHGRWQLVNLSEAPAFGALVGERLRGILPFANRFGTPMGFQLQFGDAFLNVFVWADELRVTWGAEGVPKWSYDGEQS